MSRRTRIRIVLLERVVGQCGTHPLAYIDHLACRFNQRRTLIIGNIVSIIGCTGLIHLKQARSYPPLPHSTPVQTPVKAGPRRQLILRR